MIDTGTVIAPELTTQTALGYSFPMMNVALFYRNGTAFEGTPQQLGKRVGITRVRTCGRCGGAGGGSQWAHTGWTCYDCGGTGTRGTEFVSLYTAEKLAKLEAAAAVREGKRAAKAAAVREAKAAEQAANAVKFETDHAALLVRATPWLADATLADVIAKGRMFATLSDKQLQLVAAICERHEAAARAKETSQHVGTVGQRLEIPVTVQRVGSYERQRYMSHYAETVWIVTMVDAAGNQIVSKTPNFNEEVGSTFVLRATVKAHDTYKDTKQTVVNRAARKEAK